MDNDIINSENFSREEMAKKNNQDINRRLELEKELNIQRKGSKKYPNSSDIKMNHLNYYHQIAKNNIHNLMNNPTMKDIYRITSNESVFDMLKEKEKEEQSKELSKFLEQFPLKRVERINYKGLEIGNMRKSLQTNDNYDFINKEKGEQIAGNLFEKRKKEGSVNYIPMLSMDNLDTLKSYNMEQKKKIQIENESKNNLTNSNNETWFKKYKHNNINLKVKEENNNDTNKENKIQVNKKKKDSGEVKEEVKQEIKIVGRKNSTNAEKPIVPSEKKFTRRTISMNYNQTNKAKFEMKLSGDKLEGNEKKDGNNNMKYRRANTNQIRY